jgi:hypothetical protein
MGGLNCARRARFLSAVMTASILRGQTVALDRNRHAVFVVVTAAMCDVGAALVKVAPLRRLQRVGNGVKFRILWRMRFDFARHVLLIGVSRLEAGALALRPEATK